MSLAQAMIAELEQEGAGIRKTLERIPDESFAWKPHEKSFSMIELASHLAESVGWVAELMDADEFVMPEEYKSWVAASGQELMAKLEEALQTAKTKLQEASDEKLMAPWRFVAGGEVVFEMPRVAVLRGMVLNHAIHHRGQLTVYLRLNDLPVPALYGPSADEQE